VAIFGSLPFSTASHTMADAAQGGEGGGREGGEGVGVANPAAAAHARAVFEAAQAAAAANTRAEKTFR